MFHAVSDNLNRKKSSTFRIESQNCVTKWRVESNLVMSRNGKSEPAKHDYVFDRSGSECIWPDVGDVEFVRQKE